MSNYLTGCEDSYNIKSSKYIYIYIYLCFFISYHVKYITVCLQGTSSCFNHSLRNTSSFCPGGRIAAVLGVEGRRRIVRDAGREVICEASNSCVLKNGKAIYSNLLGSSTKEPLKLLIQHEPLSLMHCKGVLLMKGRQKTWQTLFCLLRDQQ